jgi:hypothetical protein
VLLHVQRRVGRDLAGGLAAASARPVGPRVNPPLRDLAESLELPDAARDVRGRPLTGEPPDPTKNPAGCRFHPRCLRTAALPAGDAREQLCRATPVPVLPAMPPDGDPASLVACHLVGLGVPDAIESSQPSPQGAQ